MPYNFVTDSFHTKKRCSRLLSSDFTVKTAVLHFSAPPLEFCTVWRWDCTTKLQMSYCWNCWIECV